MSIVENIKFLCKQVGTSIPKLEKELGFSHGAIYGWDKSSPSIDRVQKVATYFKESTDYIMYGFERGEIAKALNHLRDVVGLDNIRETLGLTSADSVSNFLDERPSIELIKKIASIIPNGDLYTSEAYLLRAAGYSEDEASSPEVNSLEEEGGLEWLAKVLSLAGYSVTIYNNDGIFYAKITPRSVNLPLGDLLQQGIQIFKKLENSDGDWSADELEEIETFKELIKIRRQKKKPTNKE